MLYSEMPHICLKLNDINAHWNIPEQHLCFAPTIEFNLIA